MVENRGGERVTIAGSGKVSGGVYESVRIAGAGKIEGDVEAKTINTAGSCKIEGNAKAEELATAGTCKVAGSITAGEMKTAGTCSIEKDVKADLFKCSGSQKIGGRLSAKYTRIAGFCGVGGDVEADKFLSEGSFKIDGLLSADEIEIRLGGNCRAREIGGERIEVRRKGRHWDWRGPKLKEGIEKLSEKLDRLSGRFGVEINIDSEKVAQELDRLGEKIKFNIGGWGSGILETELIEGDEISLEWTKAKTVRGKQVTIGEGCEIERVEYSQSLEVDEAAEVKEQVKL
jgi:cytoskeletal protein CcmA (bactofilin family)